MGIIRLFAPIGAAVWALASCGSPQVRSSTTKQAAMDSPCRSVGYWKNHPEAWRIPLPLPVAPGIQFTQEQLLAVLGAPVYGNPVVSYFKQFVAALLNLAAGAMSGPGPDGGGGGPALDRSVIVNHCSGGLPCTEVPPGSDLGQSIEQKKNALEAFNTGQDGSCVAAPTCGNGQLDPGEQCDPAVPPGGPGTCGSNQFCDYASCTCQALPVCGNGVIEGWEQCEPAIPDSCPVGSACTSSCYCQPLCGNGALDPGEQCDPMVPPVGPGTCDSSQFCDYASCTCQALPVCGNGVIEGWEQCEPGLPNTCPTGTSCSPTDCYCQQTCGNGQLDPGEQCDPAAPWGAGTCGSTQFCDYGSCTCQNIPVCGNGILEQGEQCEPGLPNTCPSGMSCHATGCYCTSPCGNGQLDPGEQCDPGIPPADGGVTDGGTSGGTCGSGQYCDYSCTCQSVPVCGNGIIEQGEQCEPGLPNTCPSGMSCHGTYCYCQYPPPGPEICNDGIDNDGDGLTDCADPDCAGSSACVPPVGLIVNEVDYDSIGTDTAEFIEIKNVSPAPIDLSGMALVLINGATSAEYSRVLLSGMLEGGSYLVVAGAGVTGIDPAAMVIPFVAPQDNVQNGAPDGVALFHVPTNTMVDALSYEGSVTNATIGGAPGTYNLVEGTVLDSAVADNNLTVSSLVRCPDGQDTNDAATDWTVTAVPTPGAANACPTPEICDDGIDNDVDGLTDCADPDCAGAPNCQPPDLTGSIAGPTAACPGQVIGASLGVSVINLASAAAGPFSIGVYLSADATISTSDSLIVGGRAQVDGVAGGATITVPLLAGANVPTSVTPGSWYLGLIVDEFDAVAESNEANNTAAVPITITACQPAPSGLVINEVDYDNVGTDLREFVEIRNTSDGPVDLSSTAVILINGLDNAEYRRVELSGSLGAGANLVVATPGMTGIDPAATVFWFPFTSNNIQNGSPDGVMLFHLQSGSVVDAVSYEGAITAGTVNGFSGTYNLVEGTLLDPTRADSNSVETSLARCPDGQDTNDANADWALSTVPTPGGANACPP